MRFRTLNQKGFGVIEVLLILVILGLITGVGTYVYMQRNERSKKQTSINSFEECKAAGYPIAESYPEQCHANGKAFVNEAQKPQQDPQNETANWLLYQPPNQEYSIRIPDGWEVHRYMKGSHLFSDKIVYKAGTKATVIEDEGGRDFSYLPFGLTYFANKEEDVSNQPGTKTKTFKTIQGDEVVLYEDSKKAELDGMGPPKDTKTYNYWIVKGNFVVHITHEVLESDKPQTELIEKAIATLLIK